MKPFNLASALAGKPICDRDGNEMKNFRVRTHNDPRCVGSFEEYPYVAENSVDITLGFTKNGVYDLCADQSDSDLFMMYEQSDYIQEIALMKEKLQKLEEQIKSNFEKETDPYQEFKDAIAQGKEVQVKLDSEWVSPDDLGLSEWSWYAPVEDYRIKPEMRKYRVYEWRFDDFNENMLLILENESEEAEVSGDIDFVRWITDWVGVEE